MVPNIRTMKIFELLLVQQPYYYSEFGFNTRSDFGSGARSSICYLV